MLHIYWTHLSETDTLAAHQPTLDTFPTWLQQKVTAHRKPTAALASYWGYRLLQLATAHWSQPVWNALTTDSLGRPVLTDSTFDFNLSHSGNCVVCALNQAGRVGVDTQQRSHQTKLSPIHQSLFQLDEWDGIRLEPASFTDLWAQKEAVAKADGRGIAAYPHIRLGAGKASVQDTGTSWAVTTLFLDSAYSTYVATPDSRAGLLHQVQLDAGLPVMTTTFFCNPPRQ